MERSLPKTPVMGPASRVRSEGEAPVDKFLPFTGSVPAPREGLFPRDVWSRRLNRNSQHGWWPSCHQPSPPSSEPLWAESRVSTCPSCAVCAAGRMGQGGRTPVNDSEPEHLGAGGTPRPPYGSEGTDSQAGQSCLHSVTTESTLGQSSRGSQDTPFPAPACWFPGTGAGSLAVHAGPGTSAHTLVSAPTPRTPKAPGRRFR